MTEDNGGYLFIPIAARWLASETDDGGGGGDDDDDDWSLTDVTFSRLFRWPNDFIHIGNALGL